MKILSNNQEMIFLILISGIFLCYAAYARSEKECIRISHLADNESHHSEYKYNILEKENIRLKAEIISLQCADREIRRCELAHREMLPSWELHP